jgi:hypothetical protein
MLFRLGCGVTAKDADDVWRILQSNSYTSVHVADVETITQIKFDDIEKNHVLPNAGNYAIRGIWFPNGI